MKQCGTPACTVCGLVPLSQGLRGTDALVASSPAMHAMLRRLALVAASDAPVVLHGESGTGKEVAARTLHANGARRDGPFVAVNVAALPADLLESELFGHARGAFTGAVAAREGLFQAAHGGTLFLDEIAEMPLGLQAKLLRVLSDGEVRRVGEDRAFASDARIVAATHRDLRERVAAGAFREDLLYRLEVITVRIPPLRERREDILPLARALLLRSGHPAASLSAGAERLLLAHRWPGNVRELANAMTHGAVLARGGTIEPEHLPERVASCEGGGPPDAATARSALRTLAEVERQHVIDVLRACGGSSSEASRALGIGRTTLWRRLRAWGLDAQP